MVYGGFSVEALHGRIEDSQSKVAITADGAWLRGNIVPLKEIMDEALQRAPTVQTVIVVKRTGQDVHMEPGRDLWYHDLMNAAHRRYAASPTEAMDAEDPLFLLYTSGTTGKPKAILHTHGGYMVGVATTLKWVFDIKEDDTLVVRRRSGLDHRAQLHRVRPAAARRDERDVRGRAQPSRSPIAGGIWSSGTA